MGSWSSITSGGLTLGAAPGSGLLFSAGATNTPPGNLLFGDINPGYPALFQPYSPPIGMNAFGAVFIDVDFEHRAAFEGFLADSFATPFRFDVPVNTGEGNFSFLGIIFDRSESLNLVFVRADWQAVSR